jgi:hypothetical protein
VIAEELVESQPFCSASLSLSSIKICYTNLYMTEHCKNKPLNTFKKIKPSNHIQKLAAAINPNV